MTRAELIALVIQKAHEYGEEPWEILGGVIAESEIVANAARYGAWPDVSFGLLQQTVKFADEGDHSASAENIDLIRRLYSDPAYALDVGIKKYAYWRHAPDVPPLTAWVAYNSPGFYHTPEESPNVENYRRSLLEAMAILDATPEAPMPVTFDPDYPAVLQNDEWSCAPTSLTWAMRALGRNPQTDWIESDMVALNLVSHEQGLLDHTGHGIVNWLQINDPKHYGSDGYGISNNQCPISWDQIIPEINAHPPYPLLLGLPNWNLNGGGHWSGVRGYDPARGVILLANPATGATYGQTELTRQQFESRAAGNASIVRVLHPDLIGTALPPPTPPPPTSSLPTRSEIDAVIATLQGWRERAPA